MGIHENTIPTYQAGLTGLVQELDNIIPAEQFAVFNNDADDLAGKHTNPLKLNVGEKAPLFSLPNASNKRIAIADLLSRGRVVLTFYRGVWCPYCNLQLATYQRMLPLIKQASASLVAVSPMTPDHSIDMVEKNALQFEVLSDIGNTIARRFTTVFKNAPAPIQAMSELGYDFYDYYGDESGDLPVPATFVIDTDGVILFAKSVSGDYRKRVETQEILEILRK